ncbi:MAG: 16S rRNA (cytosine(1402)-N(4))-methyltransferase RsmH [Rhodospirillales bacterium]|nr:16S rRNA (cytosine(1402)-N(4))-methyltransferase RsmH [Rhodospirillales bacterium]
MSTPVVANGAPEVSAYPVHAPVMLEEVLEALAPRAGAVIVDATFGAGGYSRAVLEAAACSVVGIDRDAEACARATPLIAEFAGRLSIVRGRFGDLADLAAERGLEQIDGIAFDLGVSSPQIDTPARGFSFRFDGPLDMRMDTLGGATAADAVNRLAERDLADLLFTLGGERASRRIAAAIVRARGQAPIETTARLSEIVHSVLPRAGDGLDPATRTFQALRIWVNDELGELDRGLIAAERLLAPGGRLVAVAFHSLEDRIVKTFLRQRCGAAARVSRHAPEASAAQMPLAPSFRLMTRRPLRPRDEEVERNPRARSARLRAAERTDAPIWSGPVGAGPVETRRAA